MVSSISSTSATQALYATPAKKNLDETAATPSTVATPEEQDTAAAATRSAESAAAARLGDQLSAQADASRVQRAVDESTAPPSGPPPSGPPPADEASAGTATETEATSAQAPAAGAAPAGGAPPAAAASETTETDYIAEADTNSDKTVSDEERLAYETKLRQQAEDSGTGATKASMKTDPVEALTAEVRATYGVDEEATPAVSTTA
jgi:hypothetical protein